MQARIKNMAWPSAIPDDEWEEVAAGIPSKSEPFIAKFVSGREALIREEKKQRSGNTSPLPSKPLYQT
jgi:adenosine deaminase CECR1